MCGRIQNSLFDYSKKHPAVLPHKHHFTTFIAQHEHVRLLHAGPQALLAAIRERFWPLSGRNLVKRIVQAGPNSTLLKGNSIIQMR